MSIEKVEQLKKDKGFRIWDLIVYGVIVVIIVVIFVAVYSTKDTTSFEGIKVTVQGSDVFRYSFDNKKIDYIDEKTVTVLTEDENTLEVKVVCGGGYNVFTVNKKGSVKMKETDCSAFHPDCLYMAAIKDNNGFIYCLPHGLRIEPYKYVPDNDITM